MSTVPSTAVEPQRLKNYLEMPLIKQRIEELMKDGSAGFITGIMSVVNGNDALKACTPQSIVTAALQAAALKLPLGAGLGFAHIVPYGNEAGFQLGWKGYVQLGQRSGQYKYMQPSVVFEGQLIEHDEFTGKMKLDAKAKTSDKVIGYLFFFELVTGFEKYFYMTREKMEAHAQKYSKMYQKKKGHWVDDFDGQGLKTVVKMGVSKFGPMSVEMQKAVQVDQAVIKEDGTIKYEDAPAAEAETAEPSTVPSAAAEVLKPSGAPPAAAEVPIKPIVVDGAPPAKAL